MKSNTKLKIAGVAVIIISVILIVGVVSIFYDAWTYQEPTPNGKTVCIVFDDGYKSQQDALLILNKYNYKATISVITEYALEEYPSYMTIKDLQDLQFSYKHEIASHSINNPDLNHLTEDQLHHQIGDSLIELLANNLYPNIFVYPHGSGANNETVRQIVSNYYDYARGTNPQPLNTQNFDKLNINTYQISDSTTNFEEIVQNQTENEVVVLSYHQFDEYGEYNTSLETFWAQMKYLYQQGFEVKTLESVLLTTAYQENSSA